jgi:lysophospholipase L1-like esterase
MPGRTDGRTDGRTGRAARRGDQGSAALEYVGAVSLAAVVFAAVLLAFTPMGNQIRDTAGRAICQIIALPGCPSIGVGQTPLAQATSGRYVALGDSFSSGEGAGDYAKGTNFDDRDDLWPFNDDSEKHNRCHRSANAYSQVIADDNTFAGGNTFVACSGAVLSSFTSQNSANTGESPQFDALGPDVSLVTLTISGNDLGFSSVLQDCIINGQRGVGFVSSCQEKHQDKIDALLPQIQQQLVDTYRAIAAKAPNARVVVVGYPPLFDTAHGDSGRNLLYVEDMAWMNDQAGRLNAVIKAAAQQAGVEFVDPSPLFRNHGIGSDDPWFNDISAPGPGISLVDPGSFHPNASGQAAIAQAVQAQLENPR